MDAVDSAEFPDWEVLHSSEHAVDDFVGTHSDSSDAVITSDYFSLHPNDSARDPSEEQNFDASDAREIVRNNEFATEMEAEHNEFTDADVTKESNPVDNSKTLEGLQELGEDPRICDKSSEKCSSDSGGGDGLISDDDAKMAEASESEISTSELDLGVGGLESSMVVEEEEHSVEHTSVGCGDEGEKRRIVWWKVPFEVLKYWVVRASPVWTFSVAAAAFAGFVILARRLYRMKRKRQSMNLKVAVDDKKLSQFTDRAARLNEAFSIVRRVPIIRPSLPASGVTSWPVMSMR